MKQEALIVCNADNDTFVSIDLIPDDFFTIPFVAIETDFIMSVNSFYDNLILNYVNEDGRKDSFFGRVYGSIVIFENGLRFDLRTRFKNKTLIKLYQYQVYFIHFIFNLKPIKEAFNFYNRGLKSRQYFKFQIIRFFTSPFKFYYKILAHSFVVKSHCTNYDALSKTENMYDLEVCVLKYHDLSIDKLNSLFLEKGITLINRNNNQLFKLEQSLANA